MEDLWIEKGAEFPSFALGFWLLRNIENKTQDSFYHPIPHISPYCCARHIHNSIWCFRYPQLNNRFYTIYNIFKVHTSKYCDKITPWQKD